ncbi:MAG: DUF4097 family beta strand repeat-containing protein [bacterium]
MYNIKYPILVFALLASSSLLAIPEVKTYNASEIRSLDISNESGDIKISATEGDKAEVRVNKVQFTNGCKLVVEMDGSTLVIKNEDNFIFSGDIVCNVGLDIKVPKQVAIQIENESGNVSINGTKGDLKFKLGNGNIDINAEVDELNGRSGDGNISFNGLAKDTSLKIGKGNIKLTYKKVLEKSHVDINPGSGNSTIYLPAESLVKASKRSGNGKIFNEFGNSSSPNLSVLMRSGSGTVTIKKI